MLEKGIAECQRALALDPILANVHAQIGIASLVNGHPEETESHVREAMEASPRDITMFIWIADIAVAKLYSEADEEAVAGLRRFRLLPKLCNRAFLSQPLWSYSADTTTRRRKSKPDWRSIPNSPSTASAPRRAERQSDIPGAARADHRSHAEGRDSPRV